MKDLDSIFLLNEDGNLERVPYQRYDEEETLQGLVEQHPELIVGDQINPENPPRWITVFSET